MHNSHFSGLNLITPQRTDVTNTLPAPYNGCLLVGALRYPTWAKYVPLLVFEARKHTFVGGLHISIQDSSSHAQFSWF